MTALATPQRPSTHRAHHADHRPPLNAAIQPPQAFSTPPRLAHSIGALLPEGESDAARFEAALPRLAPAFAPVEAARREAGSLWVLTEDAGRHTARRFWADALQVGVGLASPGAFPWCLANAPCGALARAFGIRGPNTTWLAPLQRSSGQGARPPHPTNPTHPTHPAHPGSSGEPIASPAPQDPLHDGDAGPAEVLAQLAAAWLDDAAEAEFATRATRAASAAEEDHRQHAWVVALRMGAQAEAPARVQVWHWWIDEPVALPDIGLFARTMGWLMAADWLNGEPVPSARRTPLRHHGD